MDCRKCMKTGMGDGQGSGEGRSMSGAFARQPSSRVLRPRHECHRFDSEGLGLAIGWKPVSS